MSLIREVTIENFKSIRSSKFELGRVNVLIGENGSGKSNVLEGIAFASAAERQKLDNEYLAPRGIRMAAPEFMRSAFDASATRMPIKVSLTTDAGKQYALEMGSDDAGAWQVSPSPGERAADLIRQSLHVASNDTERKILERVLARPEMLSELANITLLRSQGTGFLIFAPENSALRTFQSEGQILPLSVRGVGLFAHLKALTGADTVAQFEEISEHLSLLDWFERTEIPKDLAPGERSILIRDRYLAEGSLFDQRSANEGFLFLLFYLTLFISNSTPSFFAIDNVDTSFNPKMCREVVKRLIELAAKHDKQAIFTTHNPAVLDALNLDDPEQRLFVVERGHDGATQVRRVDAPKPVDGRAPVALSQAFVRGYLGGLPTNF